MQLNISNEKYKKYIKRQRLFSFGYSNNGALMYDTRPLKLVHCCPKAVNCQRHPSLLPFPADKHALCYEKYLKIAKRIFEKPKVPRKQFNAH